MKMLTIVYQEDSIFISVTNILMGSGRTCYIPYDSPKANSLQLFLNGLDGLDIYENRVSVILE